MAVIGKLLGGAAGLALGGPLGGLLGVATGHALDVATTPDGPTNTTVPAVDGADGTRTVAFTIGVIALSAKMAKADGLVTASEIVAFREVFHVPEEDLDAVGRVFDRARKDIAGFEAYAGQLARMFEGRPAVLEELLSCLFHIAKADGSVHPAERAYLAEVARIFGFDAERFERMYAREVGGPTCDPYTVLGLDCGAPFEEVRHAYRRLVRENHPDRLIADGLPEDIVDLAQGRMAAINDAFATIEARHRDAPTAT